MADTSSTSVGIASSKAAVAASPSSSTASLRSSYNPFTQAQIDDPYTVWALARSTAPVFYSEVLDAWVVTRHHLVQSILQDALTDDLIKAGANGEPAGHADDTTDVSAESPVAKAPVLAQPGSAGDQEWNF